jgi:hypothetical protein
VEQSLSSSVIDLESASEPRLHPITHRAMWPVSWHLKHFFVDSSLGARQSRAKWFSPLQRLEQCEQWYVSSHLIAPGGFHSLALDRGAVRVGGLAGTSVEAARETAAGGKATTEAAADAGAHAGDVA